MYYTFAIPLSSYQWLNSVFISSLLNYVPLKRLFNMYVKKITRDVIIQQINLNR